MFKAIEGIILDGGQPGRAFGDCGIYSANCSVGYSGNPTKITLSVIANTLAVLKLHINSSILEVDQNGAGPLGHDVEGQAITGHSIQIGSVIFSNMYLSSYSYNITANAKTATLVFVDFSQAFDKIFVGLVGRHDTQTSNDLIYKEGEPNLIGNPATNEFFNTFWHSSNTDLNNGGDHWYNKAEDVNFQVVCLECNSLNPRRLLWPGINVGGVSTQPGDSMNAWPWNAPYPTPGNHLSSAVNQTGKVTRTVAVAGQKFQFGGMDGVWVSKNLRTGNWKTAVNGGYVTIGREQFQETNCEIGKVEYLFTDLIKVFDSIGIPHNLSNPTFLNRACSQDVNGTCYLASYTGTLREVLTAWGADLAFDWTIDSRDPNGVPILHAVDLVQGANLNNVRSAIDNSFDGTDLGLIKNYSTSVTKENTYKVEPLVKYIKPPRTIERQQQHDAYKEGKTITIADAIGDVANLGRTYTDLYISVGLAKYSPEARLLWLSDQASNKPQRQIWYQPDGVSNGGDINGTAWSVSCNCYNADPNPQQNCGALQNPYPCYSNAGTAIALGSSIDILVPSETILNPPYAVTPEGPAGFYREMGTNALKNRNNNLVGPGIKSGAFVSLGFFPVETLVENMRRPIASKNPDGSPARPLYWNEYRGIVHMQTTKPHCSGAAGTAFPESPLTSNGDQWLQKASNVQPNGVAASSLSAGEPCIGMFDPTAPLNADLGSNAWTYWCRGEDHVCPGGTITGPMVGAIWPDTAEITLPLPQRLAVYTRKKRLLQMFKKQRGGANEANLQHPIWRNPDAYEVWIGIYNKEYQDAVGMYDQELANDFLGKYGMFHDNTPKSYNYCPDMEMGDGTEHKFQQFTLEVGTIPDSKLFSGHSYPFKKILRVNHGQFNPDAINSPAHYSSQPLAGGRPWQRGRTVLGQNNGKNIFDIDDNAWGTAQANVEWALENPYNAAHVEVTFGGNLHNQIMQSDMENFSPIYSYWDGRADFHQYFSKIFNNFNEYVMRGSGQYSGYRGGIAIVPKLDAVHPSDHPSHAGRPVATGFNEKKILDITWGNNDMHKPNWAADLALGNINNPYRRWLPGGDDAYMWCLEFGCQGSAGGWLPPGGSAQQCNIEACHNYFKNIVPNQGNGGLWWPEGHWRQPRGKETIGNLGQIVKVIKYAPPRVGVHKVHAGEIHWKLIDDANNPNGAKISSMPVDQTAGIPVIGGVTYDNPVGGLRIGEIEENPVVFKNARRRALERFNNSTPKKDCTLYCEENIVEEICECEPYEEPNHGFLSYRGYTMKLNHLGRYVKIIYPIEGTYSGYFSAKSTSRGTIRKQQQVIGRPDPNPGNVMSTRITDIDATPDINAIENDTGFRKRVVAKTPPTLANPNGNVSIYSLESYYQYLTMLNQDVSSAAETISVSIDGTDFAGLDGFMDPAHGLSSFSISLGADGVASDIVFADRPPKLPKRDLLLQQVGPRITDGRMGRGAQKNIAGGARYGFGT